MLDMYLLRLPLHRSERMMDMAQASLYGQLTSDSRQKMWNNWSDVIHRINAYMIHHYAILEERNPISWNGQVMSIKGLIRKFAEHFGGGSVVR
jgi:hypothetical protein